MLSERSKSQFEGRKTCKGKLLKLTFGKRSHVIVNMFGYPGLWRRRVAELILQETIQERLC